MYSTLLPLVQKHGAKTLDDVIEIVNGYVESDSVWTLFGGKIIFKEAQTPLVYDPMSTIVFKYASCTGISITFAAALRAMGVPSRIAGTPAWHSDPAQGNHNWVEVWRGPKLGWSFIEGMPAGGGETLSNPCDKWFCNKAHFPSPNNTTVFAPTFDQNSSVRYPMAWDPKNTQVPQPIRLFIVIIIVLQKYVAMHEYLKLLPPLIALAVA
jgi:hypothetical protein